MIYCRYKVKLLPGSTKRGKGEVLNCQRYLNKIIDFCRKSINKSIALTVVKVSSIELTLISFA